MERKNELMQMHNLVVDKMIGKGGFGECYLVKMKNYSETFVCKAIQRDSNNDEALKSWKSEVSALIKIINPYVVKIYDFWSVENYYFLILEYCPNGSLKDYIKKEGRVEIQLLRRFIDEMIAGFEFCHSLKIAHHDIKPANILLDALNRIRITDFGLAQIENGNESENFAGSFIYKPPEILLKKPYDIYKADVWSFGVTIYELATGEPPWEGQSIRELITEMTMGIDQFNESIPSDIYKLIRMCLLMNPAKRPAFSQMKNIVNKVQLPPLKKAKSKNQITSSNSLLGFKTVAIPHRISNKPQRQIPKAPSFK